MDENVHDKFESVLKKMLDSFGLKLNFSEEEEEEDRKLRRKGDYGMIISKTQDKLDDLNDRIEKLLKESGLSRDQIKEYAENPDHFTKEQWESLQAFKQEVSLFQKEITVILPEKTASKKKEKKKKPLKGFVKRKHWKPS